MEDEEEEDGDFRGVVPEYNRKLEEIILQYRDNQYFI
jgi:hypothetical protein